MRHASEGRVVRDRLRRRRPEAGGDFHHRKAVLRVPDRRREVGRERQLAEPIVQRGPTADRSRHRHGERPAVRHFGKTFQQIGAERPRRPPARVQAVDLVLPGDVDDGKQVAADAVHHRLGHAGDRIRRDRRIDRVAAAREDLHRRLRRERLAGRRHPVLRGGDRTSGDGKSSGE